MTPHPQPRPSCPQLGMPPNTSASPGDKKGASSKIALFGAIQCPLGNSFDTDKSFQPRTTLRLALWGLLTQIWTDSPVTACLGPASSPSPRPRMPSHTPYLIAAHNSHAPSSSAIGSLEDDGKAVRLRELLRLAQRGDGGICPGDHRHS